ncbi:MAG: serine hydrolase [Robiginitomaculum sp.]|nr:serine hydrolase [Robiginitomaculum sp.]MDQ7077477.1 serine hydrolase [Robiginitomaculum sp.]
MTIKMAVATAFAFLLVLAHGALAQGLYPLPPQPEGQAWPGANWEEGILPPQTKAPLEALLDDAMARELDDVMGQTRAIVIIHKGKMVAERYRDGFGPDTKQVSWSMAKSFTSALVGTAVKRGMIADLDAPMPGPWSPDDPRAAITWRQWLNMVDGLDYHEIGEADLAKNDVVQMMFGKGRYDVIAYAKALPLIHTPGTHWNYSTAGFHLLAHAIQGLLHDHTPKAMVDYANTNLFDPIGMDARIEFDPAGTFLGGSLVWASARDFARFGYLYLRDGVWNNERVLPEGWVDFSRTKSPAENVTVYGAGWWINAANADDIRPKGQGSALGPRDAFSAQGHEGQIIWVVPSRDLVIVRLGLMGNGGQSWPALYDWAQKVAMTFEEVPH